MNTIKRLTIEHLYNEIDHAAQTAAPLFNLYGWTYGLNGSGAAIPTHSDLVETITELTQHALDHFYNSNEEYRDAEVGSGRFSVRIKEYEDSVQARIVLDMGEKTWFKA